MCARSSPGRAPGSIAAGASTVLFVDEIHRFNKAQQDALLPQVEDGTLTLIGATTENPYFEVNSALLSRLRVFRLEPLSDEELGALVDRALADDRGYAGAVELPDDAREHLVAISAGDARTVLNVLEAAAGDGGRGRPGRGAPGASARWSSSRPPRSSASWPTTGRRRSLRHVSARSSRACAATTRTRRSTGWRRWSRRARTRGSSRGGSSSAPSRTSATPTRGRSRWPSRRRRRSTGSGCRRRSTRWRRRPATWRRHPSRTGSGQAYWAAMADVQSARLAAGAAAPAATRRSPRMRAHGIGVGYRLPARLRGRRRGAAVPAGPARGSRATTRPRDQGMERLIGERLERLRGGTQQAAPREAAREPLGRDQVSTAGRAVPRRPGHTIRALATQPTGGAHVRRGPRADPARASRPSRSWPIRGSSACSARSTGTCSRTGPSPTTRPSREAACS